MAKKEKAKNAKQLAFEKKQEKEGSQVVMWIIGVLIVLGALYAGWTIWLAS